MTQWHHYGTADGGWIDPPPGMMYIPEPTPLPPPNLGVVLSGHTEVMHHPASDSYLLGQLDWAKQDVHPVDPTYLPNGTQIATTFGVSTVHASFDFETYSPAGYVVEPTGRVRGVGSQGAGGLKVVGTPEYFFYPGAEVLSLVYDLKDGRGRRHWAPGFPAPQDLLDYIAAGGLIEAWNITFEFYAWNALCVRRLGWPPLLLEQCRCAMAKARRYSLPGSLDNAAKVLGTPRKDADGKRLLEKLSRPLTPTKKRPAIRWTPATAWPDFVALYKYNDGDVVAEDHASARIPDLTPYELAVWQLDQTINLRGVQVDVVTLDAALDVFEQASLRYTRELQQITEGHVGSVSEVAKFGEWLSAKGVPVVDLKKDTVADTIKLLEAQGKKGTPPHRALEIRETLGAANVKKLFKLRLQVSSDGRLRNQYMYCGADQTGRWSSAAADDGASNSQLQNITAKGPKTCRCEGCNQIFGQDVVSIGCPRCGSWMFHELGDWTIEAVEQAIADIRSRSLDWVERCWGDAVVVLCGCLRGLFIAAEGKKLVCVDFSAIEAVGAACLSRCPWRIEVFSTHGKIYEMSASKITGTPLAEYESYKAQNGMHHPDRKKIGKVAELACFTARTPVLTKRGYVCIVDVTENDYLWDGVEWVQSGGVVCKGQRNVLALDGVEMTPSHPISLNGSWKEARLLASSQSMLRQALATGSANLPSCAVKMGSESGAQSCNAVVGASRTFARCLTSTKARARAAARAVGVRVQRPILRITRMLPMSCRIARTAVAWSIGLERLSPDATALKASSIATMAGGVSSSPPSGGETAGHAHFCSTSSNSKGGTTPRSTWTALTLTGGMRRVMCDLFRGLKTPATSERSGSCKLESPTSKVVYDIVNAGPRHRFTIKTDSGHLLVHNSGYGGWIGAWKNFGADMSDDEIKSQILAWRDASPEIVEIWGGQFLWCGPGKWDYRPALFGLEGAFIAAVRNPGQWFEYYDIAYIYRDDIVFCRLPSGRFLYYHRPRLIPAVDKLKRGPCVQITFEGYNSNSQKGRIGWITKETYGGRLFENVDQAVCRDIQADFLLRAEAAGYHIVMHTHDEGCAEVPENWGSVEELVAIASVRPAWASWWPIRAAGWQHKRYQKD